MKRLLSILICALLMCTLFAGLTVSAADIDIQDGVVSGNTGAGITNYPMLCQDVLSGYASMSSKRNTTIFTTKYVEGTSSCYAVKNASGKYKFKENYARTAYAPNKNGFSYNMQEQTIDINYVYGKTVSATYRKEGLKTGVFYCYTRITYEIPNETPLQQRHAGVGRYYTYS